MPNSSIQNTILDRIERISHIGYWRYNIKENELFWSDELYRIHGLNFTDYTPEVDSAIGTYLPEDQKTIRDTFDKSIENKEPFEFQTRLNRPNGEIRNVICQGECEVDTNGKVVSIFGTLQDITYLKDIQEKLEQSNKDLEYFASTAAHDLKAPLRSISGFMGLLKDQYGDILDDTAQEYIEFAVTGAQDLSELVENLLQYARIGAEDLILQDVNLDTLMKTSIRMMKETVRETGATFDMDELPIIECDEHKFKSLFGNLIENALKYSAEGTKPHIKISAEKKDMNWIFCVQDNGIGIKSENLEKIFIMFKRLHTKETYSGTGIGLAICDKIVKLHDGEIWAESNPGEGTSFYFTIPQK